MTAVPFTIGSLYAGFGQVEGLIRDDGDAVCIEFQITDSLAGVFKSGVREVRVPMKDLVSVTLTKGWLGSSWLGVRIDLQAMRMETFRDVPGAVQGRLQLGIARKDCDAAERFVAGLHEQDGPIELTGGPPAGPR
jgi:hypothetical protein